MALQSYPDILFQIATLEANVGSLPDDIKVYDQFYKSLILGLLFTKRCESETYDFLDLNPKECIKMR